MPANRSDRVKLSVHTSTNGNWIFVVSRAYALNLVETLKEVDFKAGGGFITIKGVMNDLDANCMELTVRKIIVTAIYIQEANRM